MRTIATLVFATVAAMEMCAVNPVVKTSFTPDPAPYVHNDTVYLLPDMTRTMPSISR